MKHDDANRIWYSIDTGSRDCKIVVKMWRAVHECEVHS